MLNVTVASIGKLAVVGCEGRMVARESAYKLREAVISQTDARIVVLELSEVRALGGGGFGMLVFLQRWAREHNIRFLLLRARMGAAFGFFMAIAFAISALVTAMRGNLWYAAAICVAVLCSETLLILRWWTRRTSA
jgi:hypothetical protein